MLANNEVGTVAAAAPRSMSLVRERAPRAIVHTDAVQAFLWLDVASVARRASTASASAPTSSAGRRVWARWSCATASSSSRCCSAAARSATAAAARTTWPASSPWPRPCEATTADAPSRRSTRGRRCATGSSTGCRARSGGIHETVPRRDKVAGSAHVCIDGVESEALLFLLDRGGRLRVGSVGVCERRHGAIARPGGDGRAQGACSSALCVSRSGSPPRTPTSTLPRTSFPPPSASSGGDGDEARIDPRRHERRRRLVGRRRAAARRAMGRRRRHDAAVGRCQRHRLLLGERRGRRPARRTAAWASTISSSTSREDFDAHVVGPYVAAHADGRTPNPCVECNRHLKFDRLLAPCRSTRLRRRRYRPPRPRGAPRCAMASRAVVSTAPRIRATYCTCSMMLARVRFPVGRCRSRGAGARRCPRSADGGQAGQPRRVLHHVAPAVGRDSSADASPLTPAPVVDTAGRPVGHVDAVELVTVGQRRGLGAAGRERAALRGECRRARARRSPSGGRDRSAHRPSGRRRPALGRRRRASRGETVLVQCSAHGRPRSADVAHGGVIRWHEPQRRVAPGQSVVLYDVTDTFVLAGGTAA